MEQAINFGILTLLPAVVIFVLAIWLRRTIEPLVAGALVALFMSCKFGFLQEFVVITQEQVAANTWLLTTVVFIGIFGVLLQRSNGINGFVVWISKYMKNDKATNMMAFVLGIVIFINTYLNAIVVGNAVKPISDAQKTPREMLAYIVDSTSAPICVLIPVSTWAVFYGGLFKEQLGTNQTSFEIYMQAYPYLFYGFTAIIVVPLVIFGVIPKLFGMKKAYQRVANGGNVYSEQSAQYNVREAESMAEGDSESKSNALMFFIPLAIVIVLAIVWKDVLPATFVAIVVQFVMYLGTKTMTFSDFCDSIVEGFNSMITMVLICVIVFVVKVSLDSICFSEYVINAALPIVNAQTLPVIAFIILTLVTFVCGNCWGTSSIATPIFLPLAMACGASVPMTMAAIVCAGTFGSHACFYSDATVLTSQVCKMDNMEHAFSQLPYAVIAAVAAAALYLACGFIMT